MFETQTDLIELGYAPYNSPTPLASARGRWPAHPMPMPMRSVEMRASILGCTTPVNDGPQHTVVQAAFVAFTKWVDDGTPPPSPARFKFSSTTPPTLALDSHGNVIGGVRTPAVDVPVLDPQRRGTSRGQQALWAVRLLRFPSARAL